VRGHSDDPGIRHLSSLPTVVNVGRDVNRDDFRTRMRQGYCWYLSVSLLVVAFNVSAVAMIVCEKPDAKGANTERCHLYSD
jgi:hypothetical protein